MRTPITLDHVAVAVERWADAWPRYRRDLGGAWVAGGNGWGFASAQLRYANGMKIEVLEPWGVEDNDFLRRFLDRTGPGPHHLTFKVGDIRAALEATEAAGYRPVGVNLDDDDWKEAFLHPKDAPGVVVQLAESHNEWESDPPDELPAADAAPATLVHVAHAVARLDDGLRLFRDLLRGEEIASGEDATARWCDLAWPGPGRVRVAEPSSPGTPLTGWIGANRGRVHHLAFAGTSDRVPPVVPPEDNLGVRLVTAPDASAFASGFLPAEASAIER